MLKKYQGLGAQLINNCFEKQKLILGMVEITDSEIDGITNEGQCAENIKVAIEKKENEYDFDKPKIKGFTEIFFSWKDPWVS